MTLQHGKNDFITHLCSLRSLNLDAVVEKASQLLRNCFELPHELVFGLNHQSHQSKLQALIKAYLKFQANKNKFHQFNAAAAVVNINVNFDIIKVV